MGPNVAGQAYTLRSVRANGRVVSVSGSILSSWGWPAAASALSLVFAALVFAQWWTRRRPHQAAWAVGLLMFAAASGMEAYSEFVRHWDPTVYRIYIVLAASLVGFLGLGTLYLMSHRRIWGHIYLALLLVMTAVFLYGAFTTPLITSALVPGITVAGKPLGPSASFPRVMSLPLSITGSLLLFGGAALSVYRFARKREYAYRMWANVLIAAGTIAIASAGSMARTGRTALLYPSELVGITLLFAGFVMAGTLDKGAREIRRRRREAATS